MVTPSPQKTSDGSNGNTQVQHLYSEIEAAAAARDFQKAEALREKLLQEAPNALSEIIGAAEIIEKAKSACLDENHLAIWHALYDTLSTEEKNCLFYSMKKIVLPPKKVILSHGAYNTKLFFIDSGKVNIIFPRKGKNTVLAQLGKGSLLGEYSFTSISLCSATAVTHTDVELYYLENKATDHWQDVCPGLYDKIIDFCIEHGSFEEITKWKTLEKRSKPRYPVTGPLKCFILNKEGKKTEAGFRGELTDISPEGCAFEIRLSKKATARALLGRHLLLNFSFSTDGEEISFDRIGKIVKVSFFMNNDYCVHINFTKSINKTTLNKIVQKKEE